MKSRISFFLLFLLVALIGCTRESNNQEWNVNELEYLETRGFNVFVFHNNYPQGGQGGVEFIHNGERTAANGFITIDGSKYPRPTGAKRTVDREKKEISATVVSPEFNFNYTIRVWPENNKVHLRIDLEKPIPSEWKDKVAFNLRLFPVTYTGKTYHLGGNSGVLPVEGLDNIVSNSGGAVSPVPMSMSAMAGYYGASQGVTITPLAQGPILILAPEDPLCKLRIEQVNGNLSLIDGRNTSLGGWFVVRSVIPEGVDKGALEWVITPNLIPGWVRKPMISISQVGYHPAQVKQAIIELDTHSEISGTAVLKKFGDDGSMSEIRSGVPKEWGKFLRYKYAIFDFSDVREPGLYTLSYGNSVSEPFTISKEVYQKKVWQPTLEIYFPVQMCHMRIHDRWRVWHGACHLDDALQAPLATELVDGYKTYATTETKYRPGTNVPGLNRGGWHDAGDNDLAAGSQAQTTLFLALAGEEFGINVDQTTVMQDESFVEIRRPDGIMDLQQQIEHGVLNLLSGYRASGHSFIGIIETSAGRVFLGDVASVTDQRFFDPSARPGDAGNNRYGKADDRLVVTNKDTSLEYEVIAALVAASRLLRGYNDALAQECLSTAKKAWKYEQTHDPIIQPNAYVPGHYEREEVNATCELLVTTKEERYKKRVIELLPVIEKNIGEVGWSVARVLNLIDNENFRNGYRQALQTYKSDLDKVLSENPYGVPWRPAIWGIGWDIQEWAIRQYYLNRTFPEMFRRENVCRVVNFVLGCHPGSNTSFVSAVGAHSLIPAYGFTMHWWSYIPGGMASGTALIRPDLPELKEPFPFFAQQAEYVMPGAASYIFCVLAADKLLNE